MNKSIDEQIEELQNKIKELIEKWYGHCFSFDGIEHGSLDILLTSIKINRATKTIELAGNIIIYVTPDITFMPTLVGRGLKASPYGGSLCCKGTIELDRIPYMGYITWNSDKRDPDDDKLSIKEMIDKALTEHEISITEFKDMVESADENCSNFDFSYVTPLEEIYNNGYKSKYDRIFDAL